MGGEVWGGAWILILRRLPSQEMLPPRQHLMTQAVGGKGFDEIDLGNRGQLRYESEQMTTGLNSRVFMAVASPHVIKEGPEPEVTIRLKPKLVRLIGANAGRDEPCLVILSTD